MTALATFVAFSEALSKTQQVRAQRRAERAIAPPLEAAFRRYFARTALRFVRKLEAAGAALAYPAETAAVESLRMREALAEDEWLPLLRTAIAEAVEVVDGPVVAALAQGLIAGGKLPTREFGGPAFDLSKEAASAWLVENSATLIRNIDQTTVNQMRGLFADATEAGWSWGKLSREIRNRFDGMTKFRAETIARTEIGQAFEHGNFLQAQEIQRSGVALEKYWLTVGDDRVSETICAPNEAAGWIALTDVFPSGHERPLGHPRCRCTLRVRRQE